MTFFIITRFSKISVQGNNDRYYKMYLNKSKKPTKSSHHRIIASWVQYGIVSSGGYLLNTDPARTQNHTLGPDLSRFLLLIQFHSF